MSFPQDCWDFEIKSSYGWIECVGCADRSAYDLTVHSNKTKQKLVVKESLTEPNVYQKLDIQLVAKPFGMKFKKDAKAVEAVIRGYSQEELTKFKAELEEKKCVSSDSTSDGYSDSFISGKLLSRLKAEQNTSLLMILSRSRKSL